MVSRPPAYAELLVDSLDRYAQGFPPALAQTSSSDWQTILQQIVLNGYFTRLAVTQIQFQWNLPTIIVGYNDTIRITIEETGQPDTTFNLVIDEGYYTPDALAAEIEAEGIAGAPAGANFTCVYDTLFGGFQIGVDVPGGFAVAIVAASPGNELNQARALSTTGLYTVAGLPPLPGFTGAPPTMLATRFVDICSTTLTKFQRVKDSTTLKNPTISNVIARVYPTAPNTSVQTRGEYITDVTKLPGNSIGSTPFSLCIDYNTPKFIKWSPEEALGNFDLQLRDDFGQLLPYNPGNGGACCEYQLTILASES